MPDRENVETSKVNGECVTDKEKIKLIKEFWEITGGVGESFNMREGSVMLERKDAEELNEPISREEVEKCVKRRKNGKAPGPDGIKYKLYKNGREMMIERMTELFN